MPFVAKATDCAIASIAARLMAGEPLSNFPMRAALRAGVGPDTAAAAGRPLHPGRPDHARGSRVKEAVLPFARFPGVDPVLGPEMRSTGEVMGWDRTFALAFLKAQMGAGTILPEAGRVFLSIKDMDKTAAFAAAMPRPCRHGVRDRRHPRHRRLADRSGHHGRRRSTRSTKAARTSWTG